MLRRLLCLLTLTSFLYAGDVYELRPIYQVGDTWTSKEAQFINMTLPNMAGAEKSYQMNADVNFKVTGVDQSGAVDIEAVILTAGKDGQMEVWDRMSVDDLIGVPINIRRNPKGVIETIKAKETLDEKQQRAFQVFRQTAMNYDEMMFLPEKPVAMGESWNVTHPVLFDFNEYPMDLTYVVDCKLVEKINQKGQDLLRVTYEGEFTGSMNSGEGGKMEGKLSGQFMLRADNYHITVMDIDLLQKFTHTNPQGSYTVNFDVKMRFKSTPETQGVR